MIESTLNQWAQLLFGIYGGILAGVLYEVLRAIRHIFNNKVITIICDAIFWVLALMDVIYVMMMVSSGAFRLFIIFAIIIGFALYMFFISDLVNYIFRRLQSFFKMIYNRFIHK